MTEKLGISMSDPPGDQAPEVIPDYGYGYKILMIDSYGLLRSPQKQDIWQPHKGLTSDDVPGLENTAGIYVTDSPTAFDLKGYNRAPGAMGNITVMAKCQIWGKCVRHQNGYRAQFANPESIWIQPDPKVPQETIERLATMIRNKYAIDVEIQDYAKNFEAPPPKEYPSQGRQPKKVRYKHTVVTNQQELDQAWRNGAETIKIQGGSTQEHVSVRGMGYSKTRVLIADGAEVSIYDGEATAIGGTVYQYGGTLNAKGKTRIIFEGGRLRAGADVTIEVSSPLQYKGTSRNVGGGQTWGNLNGEVYFTRFFRGTVVDRSQPHAPDLERRLTDPNLDPDMKKSIEGLLRQHKYLSSYAARVARRLRVG